MPIIRGDYYDTDVIILSSALAFGGETEAAIELSKTYGKGTTSAEAKKSFLVSIPMRAIEGGHFDKARQAAAPLNSPSHIKAFVQAAAGDIHALRKPESVPFSATYGWDENLKRLALGLVRAKRLQESEEVISRCYRPYELAEEAVRLMVGLPTKDSHLMPLSCIERH